MSNLFESSAAGPLEDDSVLECGVCWWVYDPQTGDAEKDIRPGVAFASLSEDFRCPCCDAPKSKFMLLEGGLAGEGEEKGEGLDTRVAQLVAAFEKAEDQMVGLPVHNPKLQVEAVGFQDHPDGYLGIIITPWCMNIVLLALSSRDVPRGAIGEHLMVAFPSGTYPFIVGRMDGVGALDQCSLFSPMDVFPSHEAAKLAAEAALEGLITPPKPKERSRRSFLTGRASNDDEDDNDQAIAAE